MLRSASAIKGYAIAASDGRLGTVSDILFDDATWLIRWLVVDTGNWLPGRHVLLPPSVLGHLDATKKEFSVRLTMLQVENSPDIDTDRPVSRQMEPSIYDYFGWSRYWGKGFYIRGYGYLVGGLPKPPALESRTIEEQVAAAQRSQEDRHLRSIKAVTGYQILGRDGDIGHVDDFLIADTDWSVHYLVADTKNWWAAKKVLISPQPVLDIEWSDKRIKLDIDRQSVKDGPAYDGSILLGRVARSALASAPICDTDGAG